jgi:hypothetical protein
MRGAISIYTDKKIRSYSRKIYYTWENRNALYAKMKLGVLAGTMVPHKLQEKKKLRQKKKKIEGKKKFI